MNEREERRNRIQNMRDQMPNGLELGKLPPQAVDLEEGVLGALLLVQSAIQSVSDVLRPEIFYKESHYWIYSAIADLYKRGSQIDLLTATEELRKIGKLEIVGGQVYIAKLTNRVASSANIEIHARIIVEKYIERELIRVSNEIIKDAYDECTDVFDLFDKAQKGLETIMSQNVKGDSVSIGSMLPEMMTEIHNRNLSESGTSGIPGAISSVNQILGGYQKGDLMYIGARPGMGKTSFILCEALAMAERGIPVAVFSLEMSRLQIVMRIVSLITGIDLEDLMKRKLDETRLGELNKYITHVSNLPIFIDDTPALSIYDFGAKLKRLCEKNRVQKAFVDYVQLMTLGVNESKKMHQNRDAELSTISRNLKRYAKECGIPITALAQLSRALESRTDKRPMLSDLRESGSLEQDADIVGFLFRPEYYGQDMEGLEKGHSEFIVAKNRNGKVDTAYLKFIDYLAKYTDLGSNIQNNSVKPNTNFYEREPKGPDESPF